MLSVAGYPSSMALGRNLFIFGNYALFETAHFLFGLQPVDAYLLFKYAVVAQAPLAVIACWILARHVSGSIYSATLASLFIVFSPVFVLYGGQVMTDVPSVLLLAVALIIHLRGLKEDRVWMVLVGAALLGLGLNLRETMGVYLPWLILAPFVFGWKLNRRSVTLILISCALFFLFAFSWWAFWFLTDAHYNRVWYGWRESMQQEAARHPAITWKNLLPYLGFFFASSPLVFLSMPFAFASEWRRNKLTPMLFLAGIGLFANLALFLNYSTAINWRYFLTGLPALAPLCATFLIRAVKKRARSNRTRVRFVRDFGRSRRGDLWSISQKNKPAICRTSRDQQGVSATTRTSASRCGDDRGCANNRRDLLESDGRRSVENCRHGGRLAWR